MAEHDEVHEDAQTAPEAAEQVTDGELDEVAGGGPPIIGTLIGLTGLATGTAGNLAGEENAGVLGHVETDPTILQGLTAGGG